MINYIWTSVLNGVIFGFLDGLINANPFAQKIFEVYKPIARSSINMSLGFTLDLIYGFIMVGSFWLLHKSLPGDTPLVKGLSFGLLIWFFRVVMYTATQYMMFNISLGAVLYLLTAGLFEMLVIGLLIGLMLTKSIKK